MRTEPVLSTGPSQDGHLSQKLEDFSCWQYALPFLPSASVFIPLAWSLLSRRSSMPTWFPHLYRRHLEVSSGSTFDSYVHPWSP